MKQAAFINFCNRIMLRDMLKRDDPSFQAASMYYRQGLCHSNQNTSLFNDQYLRDGNIAKLESSLIYAVISNLRILYAMENDYLIPLSDNRLGSLICTEYKCIPEAVFNCSLSSITVENRIVPCLKVSTNNYMLLSDRELSRILRRVGMLGALATQDCLIYLLVRTQSKQKCKLLADSQLDLAKHIDHNLVLLCKILTSAAQANNIYVKHIYKLIMGVRGAIARKIIALPATDTELVKLCTERMLLKMSILEDCSNNYNILMLALEYTYDELMGVLGIIKYYKKNDILNNIKDYIIESLDLGFDEIPEDIALGGS